MVLTAGSKAPDFKLNDQAGQTHQLADYRRENDRRLFLSQG